jgi:hypothetical protein
MAISIISHMKNKKNIRRITITLSLVLLFSLSSITIRGNDSPCKNITDNRNSADVTGGLSAVNIEIVNNWNTTMNGYYNISILSYLSNREIRTHTDFSVPPNTTKTIRIRVPWFFLGHAGVNIEADSIIGSRGRAGAVFMGFVLLYLISY